MGHKAGETGQAVEKQERGAQICNVPIPVERPVRTANERMHVAQVSGHRPCWLGSKVGAPWKKPDGHPVRSKY